MDEHPIQGLMEITMQSLKEMIEVNTIIGEPVESPDGSVIIPVSKLGFGFAAGGSEFNSSSNETNSDSNTLPFGGGSSGGVSVSPVAFLIVNDKETKMIHLDENTHLYEKIIDAAPQTVQKIEELLKASNPSQHKNKQENEQTHYDI